MRVLNKKSITKETWFWNRCKTLKIWKTRHKKNSWTIKHKFSITINLSKLIMYIILI